MEEEQKQEPWGSRASRVFYVVDQRFCGVFAFSQKLLSFLSNHFSILANYEKTTAAEQFSLSRPLKDAAAASDLYLVFLYFHFSPQ